MDLSVAPLGLEGCGWDGYRVLTPPGYKLAPFWGLKKKVVGMVTGSLRHPATD